MTIHPLAQVPVSPSIASLPKVDLHLHQEANARLDRIGARRQERPPYDWQGRVDRLLEESPPGYGRLVAIFETDKALDLFGAPDSRQERFIARVVDILEEAAADGAMLVEVRFGATGAPSPPDLMPLFREAERRVRERFPRLHAEAIAFLAPRDDTGSLAETERRLEACLLAAREGLAGIDFVVDPYDTEADSSLWAIVYRLAERATDTGLGITVHAAEFSTMNLAAALATPGLRRLGHAVYAAHDSALMEQLADSGATVECCLTSNVILGGARSYEAHPIRQFVAHGIPVTLNTDNPVKLCTTIGREYAIAAALGFSTDDLLGFTRNAVRASFASAERRRAVMNEMPK